MILFKIKKFIEYHGHVSLKQIARHVGASPDAVLPMLELWIKKGIIEEHHPQANCKSSCIRCQPERTFGVRPQNSKM